MLIIIEFPQQFNEFNDSKSLISGPSHMLIIIEFPQQFNEFNDSKSLISGPSHMLIIIECPRQFNEFNDSKSLIWTHRIQWFIDLKEIRDLAPHLQTDVGSLGGCIYRELCCFWFHKHQHHIYILCCFCLPTPPGRPNKSQQAWNSKKPGKIWIPQVGGGPPKLGAKLGNPGGPHAGTATC